MADLFGWKQDDDEDVQHYKFEYLNLELALKKISNLQDSMDYFTSRHPHFRYESTFYVGPDHYTIEFEITKLK
jgi:hypothetical protein